MRLPLLLTVLFLTIMGPAQASDWSAYRDPTSTYVVDIPTASFKLGASALEGHLTLYQIGGDAIIDIYSGRNVSRLSPEQFIDRLSQAPRIADVSYRAFGRTWFVISGHYARDATDTKTLIYYGKFVFSSDLSRFAAFEISYSVAEKLRMDEIVARLEKSLHLLD
jgi:hypothetical protein